MSFTSEALDAKDDDGYTPASEAADIGDPDVIAALGFAPPERTRSPPCSQRPPHARIHVHTPPPGTKTWRSCRFVDAPEMPLPPEN